MFKSKTAAFFYKKICDKKIQSAIRNEKKAFVQMNEFSNTLQSTWHT